MYYRYWMHKAHHNVYAHYGVRTHRYKLIYYYNDARIFSISRGAWAGLLTVPAVRLLVGARS
jgi:hypothetical protein